MADRNAMSELTTTVSRLTIELADVNAKLIAALAENNALTRQLPPPPATSCAITTFIPRDPNAPKPQYTHYCFTHGIKSSHSSADCKSPAANHNVNATDTNKMGGRTTKWKVGGRA
jgi:hypothetical protein